MKLTFKTFLKSLAEDTRGDHGEYRNDTFEKTMIHRIIRACMRGGVNEKNYKIAYDFIDSDWGGLLWDMYYELFRQKDPDFTGPQNIKHFQNFDHSAKYAFTKWQHKTPFNGKIAEDIFVKGDELLAAVNPDNSRKPSTPTVISTNRRPLGRQSGLTRGLDVFYAFSYKPSEEPGGSTDLLKSFKGKGPFKFSEARRQKFLDEATTHMANEFKRLNLKADVIISPQSSSSLLTEFATMLADKLNIEAKKIGAFKKSAAIELPNDKTKAMELIAKKYVDYKYMDEKFTGDEATRERAVKEICTAVYRSIKKHGAIVSKELPKFYAKFVKNIMDIGDLDDTLDGKTVMVVDDVLSSGSTMSDLFRLCQELGAEKVFGATLFARTANTKEEK